MSRNMCLAEFIPELISGGFTILAALIAVSVGVWGFFRQKEYELVQPNKELKSDNL